MNIADLVRNYRTLTTCTANEDDARTIVFELNPTVMQTIASLFGRTPVLTYSFVSHQPGVWLLVGDVENLDQKVSGQLESIFNRNKSGEVWL